MALPLAPKAGNYALQRTVPSLQRLGIEGTSLSSSLTDLRQLVEDPPANASYNVFI